MKLSEEKTSEFWSKVEVGEPEECWIWQHRVGGSLGYGMMSVDCRDVGAHVISLAIHGHERPDGMVTLHSCDTPTCVNPRHLSFGTQLDNRQDCASKGRAATGSANGMNTHPEKNPNRTRGPWKRASGESHGQAKLNWEKVAEIRSKYTGKRGQLTELAEEYGVSRPVVSKIVRNQLWKVRSQV